LGFNESILIAAVVMKTIIIIGTWIGMNAGFVLIASANACDFDSVRLPNSNTTVSEKKISGDQEKVSKKNGSGKVQENLSTSQNRAQIAELKMQISRDYILGIKKVGAAKLHTKSDLILKGGIPGI